ncbi:MAG TPA: DUF354 domain-containing protein [Candidatus Cloacimonetes bacterium]|nr:DUF354 domain-containing protein [Candidatus Cloacimonadota bacterium]
MKIMIGTGHPKQVHFWRNIVRNLIEDGHEVKILTTDKDVTLQLLPIYGLDYEIYVKHQKSMAKKAYSMISRTYKAFIIAKRFMPDILIAGTPYLAYVGKMLGKPHIMLTDTEHANLAYWLTYPFTDVIITPSCFKGKINPKRHVAYNGYEELAYLHPNYFKPDPSVLEELSLDKDDKFIIIRFVAWGASHDIGQSGISDELKIGYISKLKKYGRVFISCEARLGEDFEKYKLKISPEKFHSLLSYAQLYIGEGGSTATEAAISGTPSIHISSTAKFCGVFDDLLNKYNLIYTFDNDQKALEKAVEILTNPQSKKMWMSRRDTMLKEKIDVTKFMTEFIEEYPEIFYRIKSDEVESCSQES